MTSRLPSPPPSKPSSPFGSRPPPSPSGGLGGLASRFGSKVSGTILPAVDEVVCFDFAALALPELDTLRAESEAITVKDLLVQLDQDKAFEQHLKDQLDEAWTGYHLRGALLVYLWRDDVRDCLATRLSAVKRPMIYLRATDPLLTLNVLARARTSLLVAAAPLALERPFLERALACDDPRLIALARASGVSVEKLADEPEEPEIEESE